MLGRSIYCVDGLWTMIDLWTGRFESSGVESKDDLVHVLCAWSRCYASLQKNENVVDKAVMSLMDVSKALASII